MSILPRSDIIQPGDTVRLRARFTGPDGNEMDLDAFPTVTVIQPSGGVIMPPTSIGVTRIAVGQYSFDYNVGLFPPIGTWRDVWTGVIDGFSVMDEFTFTVFQGQLPAVSTDNMHRLGDDPGFSYSQVEICNINNVLKILRARLKSSGKAKRTDEFGNIIYKDCDVYTVDELVTFIAASIFAFNAVPHMTNFTFNDTEIINLFCDTLAQYALYLALGSQALIERGREFQISDQGVSMTPPTISELLNSQYQKEMDSWTAKVMVQKKSLPPSPLGLGTMSFTNASPQFRRLRNLRARQIY